MYVYIYIYINDNNDNNNDDNTSNTHDVQRPPDFLPRRGDSSEYTHSRSRQRDPNPKASSLRRKEASTCKGLHSTSAASFSY